MRLLIDKISDSLRKRNGIRNGECQVTRDVIQAKQYDSNNNEINIAVPERENKGIELEESHDSCNESNLTLDKIKNKLK